MELMNDVVNTFWRVIVQIDKSNERLFSEKLNKVKKD